MRLSRALALMVATVVMAAGALVGGTGSPASAATINTVVKFEPPTYSGTGYGDYYGLYAKVYRSDGVTPVYGGNLTVYTRPLGGSAWTTLYTNDSAYVIEGFQLAESAEYKAVYSGYTAGTDTYSAATSTVLTINVKRGYKFIQKSKRKACLEVGPLSAPYKNKPVTTSYKVGKVKKWRNSWTFRTNKKSQYCFKLAKKSSTPKNVKVPKGPKVKAVRTKYKKSGGMGKYTAITKY